MSNKTAFYEKKFLNRPLRLDTTTVSGSNASTTNILVTASAAFSIGDIIQFTATGAIGWVTAVPDGTHVTIGTALSVAPTTGSINAIGFCPQAIYIGLFSAAPTDAYTAGSPNGTEPSGNGYARVQVTQANGSWAGPSGTPSSTSNSGTVTFPASTGTWGGTMGWFGIFDAATGGDLLLWNVLTQTQSVAGAGVTPSFAIGALTYSED